MAKVYDGFTFFNEMDLLELRLQHLWEAVDHFIIVEATRTFQKKPKPLYFAEARSRYKAYEEKIIHVVVDRFPSPWTKLRPVTSWHYENHQREGILRGLKNAAADDVVIISDLDEIPFADQITRFKDQKGIRVFEQLQAYYFLNYVCTHIDDFGGKAIAQKNRGGLGRWRGPVMLEKGLIKNAKITRNYRDEEGPHIQVIENGGWHLSFMGGLPKVLEKMKSWSHTEYNDRGGRDQVVANILAGRDLIGGANRFELMDLKTSSLPVIPQIFNSPFNQMLKSPEGLKRELEASF